MPRVAALARNETERYAKVAARTKSAGDTCTKKRLSLRVKRSNPVNKAVRQMAHTLFELCTLVFELYKKTPAFAGVFLRTLLGFPF